jgi:hypothetical protein
MNPDIEEFVDYFNECLDEPLKNTAIQALKTGYKNKIKVIDKKQPNIQLEPPLRYTNVSKYTIGDIKHFFSKLLPDYYE